IHSTQQTTGLSPRLPVSLYSHSSFNRTLPRPDSPSSTHPRSQPAVSVPSPPEIALKATKNDMIVTTVAPALPWATIMSIALTVVRAVFFDMLVMPLVNLSRLFWLCYGLDDEVVVTVFKSPDPLLRLAVPGHDPFLDSVAPDTGTSTKPAGSKQASASLFVQLTGIIYGFIASPKISLENQFQALQWLADFLGRDGESSAACGSILNYSGTWHEIEGMCLPRNHHYD
ncbi:hypothetical protein IWX49DRAFT_641671, partial [Phyllosticta citricarpa]